MTELRLERTRVRLEISRTSLVTANQPIGRRVIVRNENVSLDWENEVPGRRASFGREREENRERWAREIDARDLSAMRRARKATMGPI